MASLTERGIRDFFLMIGDDQPTGEVRGNHKDWKAAHIGKLVLVESPVSLYEQHHFGDRAEWGKKNRREARRVPNPPGLSVDRHVV